MKVTVFLVVMAAIAAIAVPARADLIQVYAHNSSGKTENFNAYTTGNTGSAGCNTPTLANGTGAFLCGFDLDCTGSCSVAQCFVGWSADSPTYYASTHVDVPAYGDPYLVGSKTDDGSISLGEGTYHLYWALVGTAEPSS